MRDFEATASSFSSRAFELLSFSGNTRPPGLHYGYDELGAIDYACEHSVLLRKCRHFIKVSGRFLFPRITKLIDTLEDDLRVAIDCRRAYREESGVRLRARTQLIVFEREFYRQFLLGAREEMLGNCSHIEEFLAQKLQPLYRERMSGIYLRWEVECPTFGYDAASNKKHSSGQEKLKNIVRSACRRIMPAIWL